MWLRRGFFTGFLSWYISAIERAGEKTLCLHRILIQITGNQTATMPYKPKKPCKHPGCPNLTDGTYCREHARLRYQQYNSEQRDPETKNRYGSEWRSIREQFIVAFPFCQICRKYGRITRAVEVHHIVPLSEGGTHDFSNLISLCHRCHATIHAQRGDYQKKTQRSG